MAFFNVFNKEKKRKEVGLSKKKTKAVKTSKADKEIKTDEEKSVVEPVVKKAKKSSSKKKEAVSVSGSIQPYIAEKSSELNAKGIYVFRLKNNENKITVRQFIMKNYGVNPVKVNIVNLPGKKRVVRGGYALKAGAKKAMVFLKEGDKINL